MRPIVAMLMLSIAVIFTGVQTANAQDLTVPSPNILLPLPPPPPAPPPPKIEVPKIPKMGEIPPQPKARRRGSFSDRITQCIDEGAAMGLGPNERAAYSRACANSR